MFLNFYAFPISGKTLHEMISAYIFIIRERRIVRRIYIYEVSLLNAKVHSIAVL